MHYLRASSSAIIVAGPAIASSDGYSLSSALTFTTAADSILISKNGSTFANRNSTQAVTAIRGGYYTVNLSTVDVGVVGRLRVALRKNSTHIPFWEDFTVVPNNVYDSLYGGSTYLQTNAMLIETVDATNQLKAAVNDSTCEGTITNQKARRLMLSVLCGKSSGAGSTTLKFWDANSSSIQRIEADAGSSGNRISMTLVSSS